ncbi:MAG: hypothetical protein O3B24_01095 [Verrucomicrobia bacterium]|nr:hypothetical protein [Verrucomicrobiota bacterium]
MKSETLNPRVALLTWCTPDSRYAGGAAIRRLLSRLPPAQIRWCGFHAGVAAAGLPEYRAFPPHKLHWRLSGSVLEHAWVDWHKARGVARQMWAWLAPFDPQVLWVFPEVWAVAVGLELRRLSGLPLHATMHDAPESAAQAGLPRLYMPLYRRRLRALLRETGSVDAVSETLITHLRHACGLAHGAAGVVVRPAIEGQWMHTSGAAAHDVDQERRIGMCGSLRQSAGQWQRFLHVLGRLPHRIRIVSFTPSAELPSGALPPNVVLDPQPYAPSEREVITALAGVDACYLGLWREPARQLFGATSLSSKLVTYAAAGRPILVDAQANTEAWRLVSQYGAGIRLEEDARQASAALLMLLENEADWGRMCGGARRLCREEFDLERNVRQLGAQLWATARK